jgi:hypothetical protein
MDISIQCEIRAKDATNMQQAHSIQQRKVSPNVNGGKQSVTGNMQPAQKRQRMDRTALDPHGRDKSGGKGVQVRN